jgi:hypothetical protein
MRSIFRFCVFALALPLCGCPGEAMQPPKQLHAHPTQVWLEIKSGPAQPGSGFVDVLGSNQQPYNYQYTGGDDGQGNLKINSSEGVGVEIQLHLKGNNSFNLGRVYFADDDGNQLSTSKVDHRNKKIIDKNEVKQQAQYKVEVKDESVAPSVTILCDPGIINN